MAYVFSDQQNKLSNLLHDSDTSTESMFPLATRKKEINRGELRFSLLSKSIGEYATGTVSSKEISVPSDWLGTYVLIVGGVVITNDREISLAQWERYKDWAGDEPYYYYWEFSGTRKIKFIGSSGINSATYELYYYKRPTTELSADSDTSIIPEEYREASVYYAAAELMKTIGKTDLAQVYMNNFLEIAALAKSEAFDKYIDQELPRPDTGEQITTATDIQGQRVLY